MNYCRLKRDYKHMALVLIMVQGDSAVVAIYTYDDQALLDCG